MGRELELLEIWQAAASVPPPLRGVALLGASIDDPVAELDARLFALRREWFGEVMRGTAMCSHCGARIEVELQTPHPAPRAEGLTLRELLAIAQLGAESARGVDVDDAYLTMTCPDCGASCETPIDPGAFLFAEVAAAAARVLRDVHALAAAYGWSEEQVLAIPPPRRRLYIEMVTA